jgi:hypothetical protein
VTRVATGYERAWLTFRQGRTARGTEALMSDKEGILRMQPSGRWAICRPWREPVEINSGELFRVDVNGELKVTRMEF